MTGVVSSEWLLWVAPVAPTLIASTLESALGFGAAIVLLMFAQLFIFSSQLGLLPNMHPLLSSWEHWKMTTIICQVVLLVPCLIAAKPWRYACRQTLAGVLPPMILATFVGDSLELDGSSGAKFRLLIGLALGVYSAYQLGQILHNTLCSKPAATAQTETITASQASLNCVVVSADKDGMIFQSVPVTRHGFDAETGLQINDVADVNLEQFTTDSPDRSREGAVGQIQLKSITMESDTTSPRHAGIFLLKPDLLLPSDRAAVASAEQTPVPAACGEDPPRRSLSTRMGERCDECEGARESPCGVVEQHVTATLPSTVVPLVNDVVEPLLPCKKDYKLMQPDRQHALLQWVQVVSAGVCSGILGGLVGMWGPPVIMLLAGSKLSANQIRATAFCIGGTGCAIRLVTSVCGSAKQWADSWPVYTPVAVATVVGTALGFSMHSHLCQRRALFRSLMLLVMLLCAACLLVSGCISFIVDGKAHSPSLIGRVP